MQDGDTLLLLWHACKDALNLLVHLLDKRLALLLFSCDLRKNPDLALHVLVAFHVDDDGRNPICLKRRQKFFVHALIDDDEIGLTSEHLLHIDLVDLANACLILSIIGHLRLGIRSANDIAAHGMKRLKERCRQHDDALRLLSKCDLASHIVLDYGKICALLRLRRFLRAAAGKKCKHHDQKGKSACPIKISAHVQDLLQALRRVRIVDR